jgi:hypothetical protein
LRRQQLNILLSLAEAAVGLTAAAAAAQADTAPRPVLRFQQGRPLL